jgi:hypothetical protein
LSTKPCPATGGWRWRSAYTSDHSVLCCVSDMDLVNGNCKSHTSYRSIVSALKYWVDSCLHLLHETAKTYNFRSVLLCKVSIGVSIQRVFRIHGKETHSALRYTNIWRPSVSTSVFWRHSRLQHPVAALLLSGSVHFAVSQISAPYNVTTVYYTKLISSSLLLISRLQNGQRKLPRPSYTYKWNAHEMFVKECKNGKTLLRTLEDMTQRDREYKEKISFLDPKFYYRFLKSLSLVPILSRINSQGNGPIREVETCPDFFFHCKSTHNKIRCQILASNTHCKYFLKNFRSYSFFCTQNRLYQRFVQPFVALATAVYLSTDSTYA